jgi:hypothetical protein
MRKTFVSLCVLFVLNLGSAGFLQAQDNQSEKTKDKKEERSDTRSLGGKEHNAEIVGVKIGMDVPTALEAVFINANRKPGQEKPDAKRNEGKNNKDVRVLYKNLPQGELSIVFAEGKVVKEVTLKYAEVQRVENLRLPPSGGIGVALSGERFDDRYTIGFTDTKKQERIWWRDEKTNDGYQVRVSFVSANITKNIATAEQTIVAKTLAVAPEDSNKFAQAFSLTNK